MDRITIIGTGLIGTSLGLALKKIGLRDTQIVGVDKEKSRVHKAQKMGALDKVEHSIVEAVSGASVVFIATPVMAIKDVMELIGPRVPEGCLVTDTGGTKKAILEWAEEYIPQKVDFVGGHPMAGKETPGPEEAEATLFQDCRYCIVPRPGATTQGVQTLVDLVTAMKAQPYFIDAAEHDSLTGAVSHLPFLLSAALIRSISKSPQWRDISRLAASGFKDLTRLASGDVVMHRDICFTNREGILYWIDEFIAELERIKGVLKRENNSAELFSFFDKAFEEREKWLAGLAGLSSEAEDELARIDSPAQTTAQLFFGERVASKLLGGKDDGKGRKKNTR